MPARRKHTTGHKLSAVASPDLPTDQPPEPVRPAVTQVVEVVEDEPTVESAHTEESPIEEPPITEPPKEEAVNATTKSMVEELYAPEKTVGQVMPEIAMHKNSSKKPLIIWASVTIVVAILTGSILFIVSGKGSSMGVLARPTPTPTLAPTVAPTPTIAAIDKTSFEIKVLNGGGTVGAASKMRKLLEEKGYTVSGTGNTEAYNYQTTEIHGIASMAGVLQAIKVDIASSYSVGTVAADLPASSSAKVQVIVGKE